MFLLLAKSNMSVWFTLSHPALISIAGAIISCLHSLLLGSDLNRVDWKVIKSMLSLLCMSKAEVVQGVGW